MQQEGNFSCRNDRRMRRALDRLWLVWRLVLLAASLRSRLLINRSPTQRFSRTFLALAVILALSVAQARASVVISEFMALNNTTLTDEDGSYSDWIEVYNSSTNTVNLAE